MLMCILLDQYMAKRNQNGIVSEGPGIGLNALHTRTHRHSGGRVSAKITTVHKYGVQFVVPLA